MLHMDIASIAALINALVIGEIDDSDLPSGNIFDGRTSQTLVPDDDGTTITIQEYFRRHPDTVAVTTFSTGGENGIIFLGALFFSQDEYDRAITLMHESLHRAGIRDTDFGRTREEGSRAISSWLRSHCPRR
jgi:CTP:phosphocholine cytidylyltransferase-like protein